jgi:glycosyltransferase involved in cell wall biosynthesis
MALDLTIVIPTFNEASNLQGCLDAIGNTFAKQIVVVDSGSADNTKDIALRNGAEFYLFEWNGKFPKKRNWYLMNNKPSTKWVLFLDADEYLTEKFKEEVANVLNKQDEFVGYWLNYTVYFLGKSLKGGYPLKKLALFQIGTGFYEKIEEDRWSKLDMEIHEHPILVGKIGNIKSKIDHKDFRSIEHYINKHNDYSTWEAYRYIESMKNKEFKNTLTWKQRIKYKLMKSVLIGPLYFLGSYILMGGFRDGKRGLAFSIFKMSYFTEVYCKIKEMEV